MDEQSIQSIEQALQICLPQEYKTILLHYPDALAEARELHLCDDAGWLIAQNAAVRQNPASFFGKKSWDGQHFIIGEDGNGNCFYLDLHKPLPSPIFLLYHDNPEEGREVASSFEEWLPKIRQELEVYRSNAALLRENMEKRKPRKPWWKFW